MSELNNLINETLSEEAKDQIGIVQPDHINELFVDLQSINRMSEAMMYTASSSPRI